MGCVGHKEADACGLSASGLGPARQKGSRGVSSQVMLGGAVRCYEQEYLQSIRRDGVTDLTIVNCAGMFVGRVES